MKKIWQILKNTSGVFVRVQDWRDNPLYADLVYKDMSGYSFSDRKTIRENLCADRRNLQGDIKRFAGDCRTAFSVAKKN